MTSEKLDCLRVTRRCELSFISAELSSIIPEENPDKIKKSVFRIYKRIAEFAEAMEKDYKSFYTLLKTQEKTQKRLQLTKQIQALQTELELLD